MSKDANWLDKLKKKLSPENAMMAMVQNALPGLATHLSTIREDLKTRQGFKGTQSDVCFMLTAGADGQVKITLHTLAVGFEDEAGKYIRVYAPLSSINSTDLLKENGHDGEG